MYRNSKKMERELSQNNRNLIVVLTFIVLLLFGPVEPYGLIVRVAYLILIPVLLWLILSYWSSTWMLDKRSNNYINRAIYALIAGMLLVGAYFSFTADSHMVCDYIIQTRDGQECVGDYKSVDGSDIGSTFIQIVLAGIAFWMAISKRKDCEDN